VTVPEGAVKLTPSMASVEPYRLVPFLISIIQARPSIMSNRSEPKSQF
jgi:hypothetical protein